MTEYTPHSWHPNDDVTSTHLNRMEAGISVGALVTSQTITGAGEVDITWTAEGQSLNATIVIMTGDASFTIEQILGRRFLLTLYNATEADVVATLPWGLVDLTAPIETTVPVGGYVNYEIVGTMQDAGEAGIRFAWVPLWRYPPETA